MADLPLGLFDVSFLTLAKYTFIHYLKEEQEERGVKLNDQSLLLTHKNNTYGVWAIKKYVISYLQQQW